MIDLLISEFVRPCTPWLEMTNEEQMQEIQETFKAMENEGWNPKWEVVSMETMQDLRKIKIGDE